MSSSHLLKYVSPALSLVSVFWMSAASAVSIPYYPDSKAVVTGGLSYPPSPENPFVLILRPTREQRTESQHQLSDNERDHSLGHEHFNRGNGHSSHGDQDDGSADDTSTTPIPPIPSTYPAVTPSTTSAVPLPAAVWFFLSGIIGLGLTVKSRRR